MAERIHRAVRMGIDVGGTYTKCVAMDNETHEIIGKNEVKTTHDHKDGVAAGVVQSFENCMRENHIAPEDVVFVAHSTTQATNAFIEGDVANVGVVGVAGGGLEGFLAKGQLALKDIVLDEKVGRMIRVFYTFIKRRWWWTSGKKMPYLRLIRYCARTSFYVLVPGYVTIVQWIWSRFCFL
ncbi:hydantoinase/oxoprolinase N-terminal domain-containing protein [Clostridium sp. Marseille-P2415]|uniref:hydantoinase/oxoprolinase N-terminal domain-containing protein n=1 Tax=Clostridium sp. Marseille-P2415 TaxID=1805471 RepID=UPI003FA4B4E5